jgi:hypothetical protein
MLGRPNSSDMLINRLVTQEDLIELLTLKTLYEKKRKEVTDAIESGAEVEEGVHSYAVKFKLIVR